MEKNKPIILRPVAWIAIIIMMFGLQYVAELICLLGGYLIDFLNGLSLAVIVIIVVFLEAFLLEFISIQPLCFQLSLLLYPIRFIRQTMRSVIILLVFTRSLDALCLCSWALLDELMVGLCSGFMQDTFG